MPLVRISFLKGRPEGFGKKIGEIVYGAMVDTIGVPPRDLFQIITEHNRDGLIFDPIYLDIPRTDSIVFIQATISEGRTVELKQKFYREVAQRLHDRLGIRTEDVFINLIEVKRENWSFGNGVAQYVPTVAA
jgi:phenylpyruvate tautomerase PptA (4-oxalocrotonate tautomerase family)